MTEPKIRELRVTDIRCTSPYGFRALDEMHGSPGAASQTHQCRIDEHAALVAEGWNWQDVDPTDDGAARDTRKRAGIDA